MMLEETIRILSMQEEILQFPHFTNKDAWELGSYMVSEAAHNGLPVVISIRLNNGYTLFQYGFKGTNYCNEIWMKRKHNIINSLFLSPEALEKFNFERYERYKVVEENEARYEEYLCDDAEIFVVAFGIAARVSRNAVDEARKMGIKAGLIRPITLWPFPEAPFKKALKTAKHFISAELSMGQMIEDVRLATECKVPVSLCNRVGGVIMSPEEVLAAIVKANGGKN